jgi:hypothetical protein
MEVCRFCSARGHGRGGSGQSDVRYFSSLPVVSPGVPASLDADAARPGLSEMDAQSREIWLDKRPVGDGLDGTIGSYFLSSLGSLNSIVRVFVMLVSMHFLFVVQVMVSFPRAVALLFVILLLVLRSASFLERVLQILVCLFPS